MIMKLCMKLYVLKLFKVDIIDDPELTLTHFKIVKFGKTCFCIYSRPRYQVSVYRTIGPLVTECRGAVDSIISSISFYRQSYIQNISAAVDLSVSTLFCYAED